MYKLLPGRLLHPFFTNDISNKKTGICGEGQNHEMSVSLPVKCFAMCETMYIIEDDIIFHSIIVAQPGIKIQRIICGESYFP